MDSTVYIVLLAMFSTNAFAMDCSTYTNSSCACQRSESNQLIVNCTGHINGRFRLEDLVCCWDEQTEGIITIDPEDVQEIYTVYSELQVLDLRLLASFTNLVALNVSHSNLSVINWDNSTLPSLKYFDFSHNMVQNISKDFFLHNRSLAQLELSENPLDCEFLTWFIDWVRKAQNNGTKIANQKTVYCHNYNKSNVGSMVTTYIWDIIESCPKNCSCSLVLFPMIKVDCRGRNYYDFPEKIPRNTRFIYMENNEITSFRRITNSSLYQNVTRLYLDNNAIESLKELEGIDRYLNMRLNLIYLSGNKLTEFPVHVMEKLDVDVKLGGNPWRCDCESGTLFLNFVINYKKKVHDAENITCSPNDSKHPNKYILRLTPTDMCYEKTNEMHVLDFVNVALGLLIFIVLVKLTYDWWHFKHTGNLPLGPTFLAQMWKQRRLRSDHVKLDCRKRTDI